MNIINIDINELNEYEKNQRMHSIEQINKLKNSIKEFGFIVPIIIDEENVILAGHGRYMAAKELNKINIPCVYIDTLTEVQKKAFRLVDNKLTDLSNFDLQLVEDEVNSLLDDGFSFESLDMKNDFMFDEVSFEFDDDEEEHENKIISCECPKCGFTWQK